MVYLRINLANNQCNKYFLEYLKEGISEKIKELYKCKSKKEKNILDQNLKELNHRYKTDLTRSKYVKSLIESLSYSIINKTLIIQVPSKNRYYKLIKSMELGSYKIPAMPLLGKVLAIMPSLIDKLYTDYEIVIEKLSYYKIADSVKYRLLMRYNLYHLSNRLNNKVKLL